MVANQEAAATEPAPTVDPMRLASRWRSPVDWEATAAELEAESSPSELNTTNSSGLFAVISINKMSVRYLGVNLHGHDVGVVQANRPAPTCCAVYYFEMIVRNAGHKGQTSIGFTSESFKGMYDAGDHIKFGFPMAFTATMLSWSVLEYGDAQL